MRVFLTGGTGALGRFAVPALVGAGHDVTALARSDDKARWLSAQGASPIRLSIFDREALTSALVGHDALVNIATHIPPVRSVARRSAWVENDQIRRRGSATVSGAARSAGVKRYVQESITFTYPDRADAWIDEDEAIDVPDALASVAAAERSVRRFTEAGGTGVVLRFAALYGPGSRQTELLARLARWHIGSLLGLPGDYISSLHLADAGTAVVAALSAPAGTYNAVEDYPVKKRELAAVVGEAVDARPWVHLPGRLTPVLARGATAALARSHRVSNRKLRDATGWAPEYPSVHEGWAAPGMPGRATGTGGGRSRRGEERTVPMR